MTEPGLDQNGLERIKEERIIRSSVGSNHTGSSDEGTLVAEENGQITKIAVESNDSKTDNVKKLKIVINDVDYDSDEDIVTRIDSKKDSGFGSQGILKVDKFKVRKHIETIKTISLDKDELSSEKSYP